MQSAEIVSSRSLIDHSGSRHFGDSAAVSQLLSSDLEAPSVPVPPGDDCVYEEIIPKEDVKRESRT
jgi:hypothetical protein